MMEIDLEQIKAAALAATPQNIDGAELKPDADGWIDCPHCSGEGSVQLEGDYCNYDGQVIGVQFYGIGNAHGAAEAYFRAANPAVVLALIAELERLSAIVEKHIDPKQVMLTGLNVHNGSFDMGLEGGPVRLFAAAFADYFKESPASNYIEMSLGSTDPAVGELLVTLQRKQGKTPHQLRREAEARLERAEADVRRLDSGVIMTDERNDFGEEYKCERRGLDLRAMIDEAMEAGRKDARR